MPRLLPLLLSLLCFGCSYTTKAPSGAKYAVIQQPSLTSAPGVTHVERLEDGVWTYLGTFSGGTFLGEISTGAAVGAAISLHDGDGSSSSSSSSSTGSGAGWTPPGHLHHPHQFSGD